MKKWQKLSFLDKKDQKIHKFWTIIGQKIDKKDKFWTKTNF